jgi:hypothetical protein
MSVNSEQVGLDADEVLFPMDITAEDSLPDVSHWRESAKEIDAMRRQLLATSSNLSSLIDKGYNGAAHTRLQNAEHALREALRELYIASGIMK